MSAIVRVFPAEGEYICQDTQEYFPQEENMSARTKVFPAGEHVCQDKSISCRSRTRTRVYLAGGEHVSQDKSISRKEVNMSARTRVFPTGGEYVCPNERFAAGARICLPEQE
jgi:hypothetical protein